MSIDVSETLEDAMDRLVTPTGGIVVVGFAVFMWIRSILHETALGAAIEWVIDNHGAQIAQEMGYDVSASAVSVDRLIQELNERGQYVLADMVRDATTLGLDLSLPVVLVFLAVLPFIAEFLHVVGVRALADDPEELPTAAVVSGLAGVYVKSLVSNFLAWLLIGIGFLLAFIPGLVLAVVFLFVRQRVVLAGDGIFEALSTSYGTAKQNLVPVIVLFTLIMLLGVFSTVGAGMLPLPGFLYPVFTGVVVTFNLAVITSAYLQTDDPMGDDGTQY